MGFVDSFVLQLPSEQLASFTIMAKIALIWARYCLNSEHTDVHMCNMIWQIQIIKKTRD